MAKKKQQFRPDSEQTGLLSKLYITPTQRRKIVKWLLYSLQCVAVLVVQDVALSRIKVFGGMVDLTPSAIILVCMLEGAESGGVFALCASLFYLYSGTAPGSYALVLITVGGILAVIFRKNYLQRSFRANWLCAAAATFVYQLGVYAMGVFLTNTYPSHISAFLMNGLLASAALPLLYPAFRATAKIGGEKWKE
jgi:hypothetical protein